jgi:membrane protein implicated in regulation of membrane protease activity
MEWHPLFAGMLDDPYLNDIWILVVLSIVGSLLCLYRYKLAWVIIPIVSIVSAVFLIHVLEPEHYRQITTLSNSMPRILTLIIGSLALPVVATCFSWRKHRNKRAAVA